MKLELFKINLASGTNLGNGVVDVHHELWKCLLEPPALNALTFMSEMTTSRNIPGQDAVFGSAGAKTHRLRAAEVRLGW